MMILNQTGEVLDPEMSLDEFGKRFCHLACDLCGGSREEGTFTNAMAKDENGNTVLLCSSCFESDLPYEDKELFEELGVLEDPADWWK